jgi:hypothetical protein
LGSGNLREVQAEACRRIEPGVRSDQCQPI